MERTPEQLRQLAELCDELLATLRAYRPHDDAILRLEQDLEATRDDALRQARSSQAPPPPSQAPV
jgi:hypothetical protein